MRIKHRTFRAFRDGLTIRGTEYRPESGENLPIAIVSHGFLATQATTRHYARWFAGQGYAAYCFDFIGGGVGGRSDGHLRDMTVMTEKRDLLAVMDFAMKQVHNDASSLTLMGCSQGGFVSAMTAAERPDLVGKLILIYPALCIPDDARKGQMMFFRFDPANVPNTITGGPLALGGDYAKCVMDMDVFAAISPYDGPVMIVHGDQDGVVPVDYAHRAKAAYGNRAELLILPGAGHGFKPREDEAVLAAIHDFLNG